MGRIKRTSWVADFETTTDPLDCRVWGWGFCEIDTAETLDDVEIGTDISSFMDRLYKLDAIVYFHNLKFDGHFILDWLLKNGFTHTHDTPKHNQFSTLISHMGTFYSISVVWGNGRKIEFRDSYKKLPMSAANVAKSFKLEETKGTIDYHTPRPIGHKITCEEANYIARDVLIISLALKMELDAGMTKMTIGADSLAEYKKLTGSKWFATAFPILPSIIDDDIRTAYRGGFTYVAKRFRGKLLGPGRVYDVNSLYPSVMKNEALPYGEPEIFKGAPSTNGNWPLYIVSITFTAKLKKNHIPCIQIKGSAYFNSTEYLEVIKEPVTMMVTNVDLALWEEHYHLEILSYNGGYRFRSAKGVFNEFITKWMDVKANSEGGMRAIAKLHLNSLYGKFATNPNVTGKYPILENDTVKLVMGPEETRDPVYTAMGVFITAYARDKTIRAAQENYDTFAYADTDSLHLLISGKDPEGLEVHKSDLGAWKFEYAFDKGIFVRAKAYVELLNPEHWHTPEKCDRESHGAPCAHVVHIAGLPDNIADRLTLADVQDGRTFHGKHVPKRVPGGIVLEETGYTLNMK